MWLLLAAGVNDTVEHAIELAELLHEWGRGYHVNLIPFNPIEGSEYRRPYRKAVCLFSHFLASPFNPYEDEIDAFLFFLQLVEIFDMFVSFELKSISLVTSLDLI